MVMNCSQLLCDSLSAHPVIHYLQSFATSWHVDIAPAALLLTHELSFVQQFESMKQNRNHSFISLSFLLACLRGARYEDAQEPV